MKNLLVLTFDDDSEVVDIPATILFNNEKDAFEFLTEKGLTEIKIEPNYNRFKFKFNNIWRGTGRASWAKVYC